MGGRGQRAGDRDCGFGGGELGVVGLGGGGGEEWAAGDGGVDCGGGGVQVGAWAGEVGGGGTEGKAGVCEGRKGARGGHWCGAVQVTLGRFLGFWFWEWLVHVTVRIGSTVRSLSKKYLY